MDLWKIAPAGMIQELLYSGTEVFLYRTWQLNGELIQYTIAGSGNNTYHRYVVENSVGASAWSNLYKQAANADHMRQLAIRKEDPNYEAIALTLRTLFLQNIADLFGDVPCSEAFKGPSENVKQPVFDTQEQVYRVVARRSGTSQFSSTTIRWRCPARRATCFTRAISRSGASSTIRSTCDC